MKFSEIGLEQPIIQAIEKLGYENCTPIQELAFPVLLDGKDLSGLSQTGTGKTAAFLIPIMDRILKARIKHDIVEGAAEPTEEEKAKLDSRRYVDWRAQNFVLILVPTRELAEQVYENIVTLSEFSGLRAVSIYGGTSYDKQKEGLKNNVEFVVATPGRLLDLYKENICDLKQVRALVFDEADRMFDMGFKDDMKYILQRVPKERQIAVFSATMNFDVMNTLYQFGSDPVEIDVSRDQPKAENVKDEIFHVANEDKPRYLLSLIKKHQPKQTIVFSNFKNSVEHISNFLSHNGVPAVAISSLLTQAQRNRVLEQFKTENDKNILVATDVAARGLDIKGVDMVVNFDLPNDAESYVHRIGRTGRAGAEGRAFSMVSDRDVDSLVRVEDYLKHKLPIGWLDDSEIITEYKNLPHERSDRAPREGRHDGGRHEGGRHDGGRRDEGRSDGPRRDSRPGGRAGETRGPRRDARPGAAAAGGARGARPERQERGPRPEGQAPTARAGGTGGRPARNDRDGKPMPARGPGRGDARNAFATDTGTARPKAGAKNGASKGGRPVITGANKRNVHGRPGAKAPAGVLGQVKGWFRRLLN